MLFEGFLLAVVFSVFVVKMTLDKRVCNANSCNYTCGEWYFIGNR